MCTFAVSVDHEGNDALRLFSAGANNNGFKVVSSL